MTDDELRKLAETARHDLADEEAFTAWIELHRGLDPQTVLSLLDRIAAVRALCDQHHQWGGTVPIGMIRRALDGDT